ncbi:MFS general substrate transporter [Favolaschia claudopus]|uniref:MFS general substrate transporter n=1 Tax=Favolaschia claudopus TaxID=2862362 RepID=A0AAW0DPI3_9AGAR
MSWGFRSLESNFELQLALRPKTLSQGRCVEHAHLDIHTMEGYNVCLLSSFSGVPASPARTPLDGTYQVPAPWQAGLSNGANVGEIIGLFLNGWVSEKYGYRYTVMACLICLAGFQTIFFTAQNVIELQVTEILLIGIGIAKSMLPRTATNGCIKFPTRFNGWCWPLPLFIGIFLTTESPWWLKKTGFDVDKHTTKLEERIARGASYFLEQASLKASKSYEGFTLGQYAINCVAIFGAWFLMSWGVGRRSLYGLCIISLVLGFLVLVPASHRDQAANAMGSLMLVWAVIYQLTVGTVCYSLVGELSSRWLSIKTVVLGRNLYNVVGIICSVLTLYMLNPGSWNWSNYTGFFWGGICFLCIIYTYYRVPEPQGRSFARKFATTKVDVFDDIHSETTYEADANEKGEKV